MHSIELINIVRNLYDTHKCYRKVSEILQIHHSSIIYMVNNDYYKPKRKRGPPPKITNREKTKIKKEVKRLNKENKKVTASKLKESCNLSVSLRTITRKLNELGFVSSSVPKKVPLNAKHKLHRVELARKWINDGFFSNNIIFSDEKRFCFDGPDSWRSWYDPFDPPIRIKRQMGGGGIMVWGMVLPDGEVYVELLEGRVNSDKYINLLKYKVKPYLNHRFGAENYYLQQDNCSVHVSKQTLNYMKSAKIKTFEWPSMSPDLNIMENVWKMLSDIVYDGNQFYKADAMWLSVKNAVDQINLTKRENIKSFFTRYGSRLLAIIDNKGNQLKY